MKLETFNLRSMPKNNENIMQNIKRVWKKFSIAILHFISFETLFRHPNKNSNK